MRAIILKCPRGARFHFGNIALDENTSLNDSASYPHSDTLFSALINTANLLEPTATDQLVDCFAERQVQISSGFFCLEIKQEENQNWIFFLPKPVATNLLPPPEEVSFKQMRKIEFLSKGVWEAGFLPQQWYDETHCRIIGERFIVTRAEAEQLPIAVLEGRAMKLFDEKTHPKVKVHDLDQQEGYFHQTSVQLGTWVSSNRKQRVQTHYYFLLDGQAEENLQHLLEGAIHALPDTGIGGERSVGCGRLSGIEEHDFQWDLPASEWTVGLSLINPAEEMSECQYYQTIMRGGRRLAGFGTETYLQRVRMLREGALMKRSAQGKVVPIGPPDKRKRFRRYGLHLGAPLHQNVLAHVIK